MPHATPPVDTAAAGSGPALQVNLLPHGAVLALHAHGVMLNLFPGNLLEGGPANLWLRRLDGEAAGPVQAVPLLGPLSPLQPVARPWPTDDIAWCAAGTWQGLQLQLQLRVATGDVAAWFWHLGVHNGGTGPVTLDLLHVQDVGLSTPGAIRLNEYYVSHYVDLQPLPHGVHGTLLAARQNQPVAGRHPWLLMGALRPAVSFATDALQWQGTGIRAGGLPQAVRHGLPGKRLQHEHALVALQEAPLALAPGQALDSGCWGLALAHHPAASSAADTAWADVALALPQARPAWPAMAAAVADAVPAAAASLFATAAWLDTTDLTAPEVDRWLGSNRHQVEHDADGRLLSFFGEGGRHVVLRAKELAVKRPHGHLLRSGQALVPDETALTSTLWMSSGFHSMLTQGHVGINRCLGTVRSWLRLFRSHGQQVLVDAGQGWQQLGLPSAFEMQAGRCSWWYRHAGGLLQVQAWAEDAPHALGLSLQVHEGGPLRVRVTHQVSLGGDDGLPAGQPLQLQRRGETVFVPVPAGGDLARRFPQGGFTVGPVAGSRLLAWGDDALLYADGASRGQHWLCVDGEAAPHFGLRLSVQLVDGGAVPGPDAALAVPVPVPAPVVQAASLAGAASPAASPASAAERLAQLNTIQPWLLHNALVHYLSPRGLEQFSGGGWGTRDVCQGPLEMLLALDRPAPVRDLLLRVFRQQNADGDWPQWFMFFDRERTLRAGDSHGDIVFWPLVGLARYLLASGDATLLDEVVPYFDAPAQPLWLHVERALVLVAGRCVDGTRLVSYGHGDWNDSLQPADPALREHLCSTWTVTLHHQTAQLLQQALAAVGRTAQAAVLQRETERVAADFRRLALPGGVVAGYLLFDAPGAAQGAPQPLLHPQDRRTGLRYSLLPLMHAVLEDLLTPDEARHQAALIEQHLTGPDGARLFDRPLPYRGGPMTLFQRAESSAFFGREIGVMYMHAHLRWAEMLAHLGQAERFFQALCLAHPVGLAQRLPQAALRQANCYYSSSDAAFVDRWDAQAGYDRIAAGTVALEGGWRVYSSGPGLAIGLWVTRFLGLRRAFDHVVLDPVLPPVLGELRAEVPLAGMTVQLCLRPGPRGCGVQQLWLDDQPLAFTPEANPYRSGGARLALAGLRPLLQAAAGPDGATVPRLVVQTL